MNTLGGDQYLGKRLATLPKFDQEIEANGLRLILMPPGLVDTTLVNDTHLVHINLGATENELGCNTEKRDRRFVAANSLGYWPKDTLISLRVSNPSPSCMISIPDALMQNWLDRSEVPDRERGQVQNHTPDQNIASIGRSAIQYLAANTFGNDAADQLTLESFALDVSASIVAGLHRRPADRKDKMQDWARLLPSRQHLIDALEWAELNIASQKLSITSMAEMAGLSPCHFSTVFKMEFGLSPYAYILQRRAQRACDFIIGSAMPLSQIAYHTGFSSQAHMTTIVKRFSGQTPAQLRR